MQLTVVQLRPCRVKGKKALFHRWYEDKEVLAPSVMVGGHSGGQVTMLYAIVEFEDGTVKKCLPEDVKFTDNMINEYIFEEEMT